MLEGEKTWVLCVERQQSDKLLFLAFAQEIEDEWFTARPSCWKGKRKEYKVSEVFRLILHCPFRLYRFPLLGSRKATQFLFGMFASWKSQAVRIMLFFISRWKQESNHRESELIAKHDVEPQVQVPIAWLETGCHAPQARNDLRATARESCLALTD